MPCMAMLGSGTRRNDVILLIGLILFIIFTIVSAVDEVRKNPGKKQKSLPSSLGLVTIGYLLGRQFRGMGGGSGGSGFGGTGGGGGE